MTDLLVGSLMADGGLEATLDASIKIEMRDIEEKMIEGKDVGEKERIRICKGLWLMP